MQNFMEVMVLSCAREVFRGKDGRSDSIMFKLYIADSTGHVGGIYCSREVPAGTVVKLGLRERDGMLRLAVLKD